MSTKCPYCRRRYQHAAAYEKHVRTAHHDILLFCRQTADFGSATSSFFFFFFFLYHVLLVKVQELACTVRYGVKKTILLAPGKKPSTQVPLVWNQPHTSHIKKEILLPLAEAVRKEKSIKHMGRNQQENPRHRLPNRNKIKPVIHREERKVTTKAKPQKEIQNNFQQGPIEIGQTYAGER